MVQRAQQPAAYQACGKPDRGDQRHDGADTGTLAPAALTDLGRLELAFLVQDQDADSEVVGDDWARPQSRLYLFTVIAFPSW